VAPPGNQAATEKTNFNLYHSENPVYSPKVSTIKHGKSKDGDIGSKTFYGVSSNLPFLQKQLTG
jgi:hypothetical protein